MKFVIIPDSNIAWNIIRIDKKHIFKAWGVLNSYFFLNKSLWKIFHFWMNHIILKSLKKNITVCNNITEIKVMAMNLFIWILCWTFYILYNICLFWFQALSTRAPFLTSQTTSLPPSLEFYQSQWKHPDTCNSVWGPELSSSFFAAHDKIQLFSFREGRNIRCDNSRASWHLN